MWFKSYLQNRQQYTEIENAISDIDNLRCEVPQGSILRPLIPYICDIVLSSSILKFYLFADDITIFYSSKSSPGIENTLNSELNKVNTWV